MEDISSEKLNSLDGWRDFIVNIKEGNLIGVDCSLNVFGEDDSEYLVINLYEGDKESTEYFFNAESCSNKRQALLDCLKQYDYSIIQLLDGLSQAKFISGEIGDFLPVGEIKIYREHVKEN